VSPFRTQKSRGLFIVTSVRNARCSLSMLGVGVLVVDMKTRAIYRKMAAGTFPQPLKVGRRRVAWRTSDIVQ
jgi:hypothetical protein